MMTEDIGYVYILSNPSLDGLLKIGMTLRCPKKRASELYTTGIPTQFIVEYARCVFDPGMVEKKMHDCLSTRRVNPNREFFRVSLEIARWELTKFEGEDWKDESKSESLDILRRRAINQVLDHDKRELLIKYDDMTIEQENSVVSGHSTEIESNRFFNKFFYSGGEQLVNEDGEDRDRLSAPDTLIKDNNTKDSDNGGSSNAPCRDTSP